MTVIFWMTDLFIDCKSSDPRTCSSGHESSSMCAGVDDCLFDGGSAGADLCGCKDQ